MIEANDRYFFHAWFLLDIELLKSPQALRNRLDLVVSKRDDSKPPNTWHRMVRRRSGVSERRDITVDMTALSGHRVGAGLIRLPESTATCPADPFLISRRGHLRSPR